MWFPTMSEQVGGGGGGEALNTVWRGSSGSIGLESYLDVAPPLLRVSILPTYNTARSERSKIAKSPKLTFTLYWIGLRTQMIGHGSFWSPHPFFLKPNRTGEGSGVNLSSFHWIRVSNADIYSTGGTVLPVVRLYYRSPFEAVTR